MHYFRNINTGMLLVGALVVVAVIIVIRVLGSTQLIPKTKDIFKTSISPLVNTTSLSPYCIAAHLDYEDLSVVSKEKQIDLLEISGTDWVRFDFEAWRFMEQTGSADFSYFDPILAGLKEKQIGLVAILPQWGETNDEDYDEVIESPESYGIYAKHLAQYLMTKDIEFMIEVGNEPNDEGFWEDRNAEDFTMYLVSAYDEIKKVDKDIKVISGGVVMYNPSVGENGEFNAIDWLKNMYEAGVKTDDEEHPGTPKLHFDMYGVHIYPGRNEPTRHLQEIKEIKTFMASQGDNPAIAITEIGAPTGKDDSMENVTESEQANFIKGVYKDIVEDKEIAASVVCYYSLANSGTSSNMEENYGLLNEDLLPKPAFSAFQEITSD